MAYAEGRECLLHHAATLQPSDRDPLSRTLSGCHRTTTRRQVLVLGAFGSSWAAPSGSRHFQCHAVPCRAVLRRRHADRTIAKLTIVNKHGLGVKVLRNGIHVAADTRPARASPASPSLAVRPPWLGCTRHRSPRALGAALDVEWSIAVGQRRPRQSATASLVEQEAR